MTPSTTDAIRLALPKGRMQPAVLALLAEAGLPLRASARGLRPSLPLEGWEAKFLKPQNIVEMLHLGSRDVGFTGRDWVDELRADVELLLDTELDPVRIVAAVPNGRERVLSSDGELVVVSEYERLTRRWIERRGLCATFARSFGATEVFPPEDADCIVDCTATGATLAANDLEVVDELLRSSTCLFASPRALADPGRRERIESFVLLLRSVLAARERVLLELNVSAEWLEDVCAALPCMREPTVASLRGESGFAVRAAVPKRALPDLIPALKARGGTDLVVSQPSQITP